jgi:uncharacterized protein YraI
MLLHKRLAQTLTVMLITVLGYSFIGFIQAQDAVNAQAYRTVNVRSGPGTGYPVIGQLAIETVVAVTGRSDSENNWLQIDFEGQDGWVAYFTVVVEGDLSDLPIVQGTARVPGITIISAPLAAPIQEELEGAFVTSFRRVNVRSGPGTEFEPLDTLQPGETATITGRTEDNEWLQIHYGDQTGWVAYFVVSVTGSLEDVPTVAAPISPSTATSTPTTEAPPPTPNGVSLTTRFNSNLRAAPAFTAEVVAVVPFDTTLQVVARTAEKNWLRVTYDGQSGWLVTSLGNITPTLALDLVPVDTSVSDVTQ